MLPDRSHRHLLSVRNHRYDLEGAAVGFAGISIGLCLTLIHLFLVPVTNAPNEPMNRRDGLFRRELVMRMTEPGDAARFDFVLHMR